MKNLDNRDDKINFLKTLWDWAYRVAQEIEKVIMRLLSQWDDTSHIDDEIDDEIKKYNKK